MMVNQVETRDFTAPPRAVLRETMRLLYRVLGEQRLGSAQGNAWAAVCADRERAVVRAEVQTLLAAARAAAPNQNGARDRTGGRRASV